jgi:hypothetical protein
MSQSNDPEDDPLLREVVIAAKLEENGIASRTRCRAPQADADSEPEERAARVDEDWMNQFIRFAEDSSIRIPIAHIECLLVRAQHNAKNLNGAKFLGFAQFHAGGYMPQEIRFFLRMGERKLQLTRLHPEAADAVATEMQAELLQTN